MQLAEYYAPEVVSFEDGTKGIQTLLAKTFDEDGKMAVGYYFDPKKWEIADVQKWIKDNNEPTYKQFYYNWELVGEDKQWEVDTQEEEAKLPEF